MPTVMEVTVLPETVQIAVVVELKINGSPEPEEELAEILLVPPKIRRGAPLKVIT